MATESIAEQKARKKEIARIEKQMERRQERLREIESELEVHGSDHQRLLELHTEQENLQREFEELEMNWLELNVT